MSTVSDKVHLIPVFGLLFVHLVSYAQEMFGYQMTVTYRTSVSLGGHMHVAAFLVYVDDFLAAGPRDSTTSPHQTS